MYTLWAKSASHRNNGLAQSAGVSKQGFSQEGGGGRCAVGGSKYLRPELAASGNEYLRLAVKGYKRLF